MTDLQKQKIEELQLAGYGYKKISTLLGLPQNNVKAYCSRHKPDIPLCLNCGKLTPQPPHKRKKKFCSDKCRLSWWNKHPDKLRHRTERTVVCPVCGKEFKVHGSASRKYCSQACYHASSAVKEAFHE